MSNTANNGLSTAERGTDDAIIDHEEGELPPTRPFDALSVASEHGKLHRGLSARQVQMIAIAGTIGTGLFLGTGKALATGGPASMLICYAVVAVVVYVTLLLLGEMATQYPVAGQNLNYLGSSLWSGHLTVWLSCLLLPRFFQRIRDSIFLSIVRVRTFLELLVQRRSVGGW